MFSNDNTYEQLLHRVDKLERESDLKRIQEVKMEAETKIKDLQRKSETKIKDLERRLHETENCVGTSSRLSHLIRWRSTKATSGNINNNVEDGLVREDKFKLPADVYSIISAWKWNSKPFLASVSVILMQIILLAVLIVDLLGSGSANNPLNLPSNVEYTVRIAQIVAIPIAVFKQEDLRQGIEGFILGLPETFRGDDQFQSMNAMKWRVGYFLRFLQGFVSLFASFLLLMQPETVFDLLLNFLGIEFISDLDNLAFRLGGLGYFGITTADCVHTMSQAEFHRDKKQHPVGRKCSPSWCRKYAHILGVFFVLLAMFLACANYVVRQYEGEYLTEIIRVEFGDETVPYLGLFNGCYKKGEEINSGRPIYEQMGSNPMYRGKLGYCSNRDDESGGWVFFFKGDDPCTNGIVSSGETNTFDLLEASETQWYTENVLPLEYLQIYKIDEGNSAGECGSAKLSEDSCKTLELKLDGLNSEGRIFQKHEMNVSSTILETSRLRPAYVDGDEWNHSQAVIFTGRRWVLANMSKIASFTRDSTPFNEEELHEDETATEDGWIILISELVGFANDQGTPLGLQWYYPRVVDGESNMFNFHSPDLTRPVPFDSFSCVTCNLNSDCLHGGVCNVTTNACECKNGAFGRLCREKPLGDGECNPYFNTEEYGYDEGDCCAGSCEGFGCGRAGIEYPYGVDINKTKLSYALSESFGYEQCKDPKEATFTIAIEPILLRPVEFLLRNSWRIARVLVRCEDKRIMDIPEIPVCNNLTECPKFTQSFQVPVDASCEIIYIVFDPNLTGEGPAIVAETMTHLALYYGHGTGGEPIYKEVQVVDAPQYKVNRVMDWIVPSSKCILASLSNVTGSIFLKDTKENLAMNILSKDIVARALCDKGDVEQLVERFALAMFHVNFGFKDEFDRSKQFGDSHHCEKSFSDDMITACKDSFLTSLSIGSRLDINATVPPYLSLLSHLQDLTISPRGNIGYLTGPIPSEIGQLKELTNLNLSKNRLTGQLPSEIGGNLKKLTSLAIERSEWDDWMMTDYKLTGSIPSEIGSLTSLTRLTLHRNYLTGRVPSEIGNLTSLTRLDLTYNNLTGSIPSELANLRNITICIIGTGNTNVTFGSVGMCS